MKRLWLLSILFLVLAPWVSSCGCTLELRIDYDPDTTVLSVGETAPSPQIEVYGCNSPRRAVTLDQWRSQDPEIASVNPETGAITGVAPGEASIAVSGLAERERFNFSFPVTVTSP